MSNNTSPQDLKPFSLGYSPQFPEIMYRLNCTLVISTFQAGKVIFISPKDENFLVQLPRNFRKPMGVAIKEDKMAVATLNEVNILKSVPPLAKSYPNKPNTYDQLWVPRATYYTGHIDTHDLHFGADDQLWAVNTSFSCLCTINDNHNFTPQWKPPFISQLLPQDRCHLNGLAMENGKPKYITGLGKGDAPQAWRENITKRGILMDIETNEIICDTLAMPHTPRLYDGKLYCLLSADQKLVTIDPSDGHVEDVAQIPGFVRGMTRIGDYVFIATSKLRKNSSTFRHLDIPESANQASVSVLHLPTGSVMGRLHYRISVDEIYDIQILPNTIRPNILNPYKDWQYRAMHFPGLAFWGKSQQEMEAEANKKDAPKK